MNKVEPEAKKKILLVEDDATIAEGLRNIFLRYPELEIVVCGDAGEAIECLLPDSGEERPQVVILDLMLPYGDARGKLAPDADDDREIETGLRLIEFVRRVEKEKGFDPVWVAVITARSAYGVETRVSALLSDRGRLFFKPFDSLELEDEVARSVGLPSRVTALLRDGELNSGAHEVEQ